MNFTEEMINEDEKRWHARDVVTELGYCGNYMRDRKEMTNLAIRFYAYIMRKAHYMLKEQEAHVLSRDEMIEAGKNHDAVYVEEGDGRCFWGLAVEGIDPPEDKPYNYPGGVLFNVVDADDDMWDGDFYLMCDVYPEKRPHPMGWRAWSAKPTPEQMRAVKWE